MKAAACGEFTEELDLREKDAGRNCRWAFLWVGGHREIPESDKPGFVGDFLHSWAKAPHHLDLLANSMWSFSPHISIDPNGIWMEISKTAHLYGGEESTLHKALIKAETLGFKGCAVVADSPYASRLLSRTLSIAQDFRSASPFLVPRGGDAEALSSLPVSVLEPSLEALKMLKELGVSELGTLARIPSASLKARLGSEGGELSSLARAEYERFPLRYIPAEQPKAGLEFEPALSGYEPLQFVSKRLLDDLVAIVGGRGLVIDALTMEIEPLGFPALHLDIPLARPTCCADSLLRLLRERFRNLVLGSDLISRVHFQIVRMVQQPDEQNGLFERGAEVSARGSELLTRLEASLGEGAVFGASLKSTWCPEKSWGAEPFRFYEAKEALSSRDTREESRPVFIFSEPFLLEGGLKAGEKIDWPEGSGIVRAVWGPERLRALWWNEPLTRDYYVVELIDGARLWIYRDHVAEQNYLHGLFD